MVSPAFAAAKTAERFDGVALRSAARALPAPINAVAARTVAAPRRPARSARLGTTTSWKADAGMALRNLSTGLTSAPAWQGRALGERRRARAGRLQARSQLLLPNAQSQRSAGRHSTQPSGSHAFWAPACSYAALRIERTHRPRPGNEPVTAPERAERTRSDLTALPVRSSQRVTVTFAPSSAGPTPFSAVAPADAVVATRHAVAVVARATVTDFTRTTLTALEATAPWLSKARATTVCVP